MPLSDITNNACAVYSTNGPSISERHDQDARGDGVPAECVDSVHQTIVYARPPTCSKWRSEVRSSAPYSIAWAAIQMSLEGIGIP